MTSTDANLATRARDGDRASFQTLADRYAQRVFAFAHARLRNTHDAEEVVQETFLRAFGALDRFQPQRSFATWLFTIAHRETVTVLRRRAKEARDREQARREPDSSPAPVSRGSNIWTLAAQVLDDDAFAALYLRYVEDCSPRHIARILGRPGSWTRVALHRARARLSEELAPGEQDEPGAVPRAPTLAAVGPQGDH